ncbi:MAG: efflux RND transporter permease subunit [Gemmataceae bacterium]|nr:efflux RND transporter permease subunit [Gemmataceae bacterium]
MLSRFFIDRPIFATVLSVVITLIGGIALFTLPVAQYPRITPPGVQVSISYPGANAQVIADTVGAPIEQQVTGVPGLLYMSSQSSNDGSYTLSCTFDVSTNINTALVMVQNRVSMAMPLLPSPVQKQGIRIRKKTPDMLLMINFFSPDNKYDDLHLSNFAVINIQDELLRVDGVSDVKIMGQRDYSIRAWLDPQKLAALNMSAVEVAEAVRSQNIEAVAGQIGQPPTSKGQQFQKPIDTLGRLNDPEQFGDIIIKAGQTTTTPAKSPAPKRLKGGGSPGLPGSGIGDPLAAAGSMAKSIVISPGAPASTGEGQSAPTQGGVSDAGGGNTAGGAGAEGGGSTAGGAVRSSGGSADNETDDSLSGLSISAGGGGGTGGGMAGGPRAVSSPIVRLKQVARIEMGAQNYNQACWFNGQPSVGLTVYQLPGTNALDVGDEVRAKMKELSKRFPPGIDYKIGFDTTPFIRESVAEVFHTLRDAVLLVTLVVLLFLQDWRAMVLPMIDVPVSLIGTFGVMAAMGFSLNNISLFGLVLAIGIVVDDAIVVLENIERQMAKGMKAREATIKAMEEITGPIIAITVVLCAVFVPCAFISGITGRFFRQFAVTIAASTVISAINALTMTPSRALLIFRDHPPHGEEGKPHAEPKKEALPWWIFGFILGWVGVRYVARYMAEPLGLPQLSESEELDTRTWWLHASAFFLPGFLIGLFAGWFLIRPANFVLGFLFRAFNRLFDAATEAYGWVVGRALRMSAIVLIAYVGMVGITYWLFATAPTGFVPQQDQGRLLVSVQLPDSTSLERTREIMKVVERVTRETPGVSDTISIIGTSFVQQAAGPNFGSMFVILHPFRERQQPHLKDVAIMSRLRKEWNKQVRDAQVVVFGTSPVPGLSVAGGFKLMVEDKGGLGLAALQKQTDALVRELRKNRKFSTVSTQFRSNTPQLFLDIDRTKVETLGLKLEDVNQTVQMYLGSVYVNSFNQFGRHWQVTLQSEGTFRNDPAKLNLFKVRNKYGQMVSLGTLATLKEINGPIFVTRFNLSVAAPITGSLAAGIDSGEVIGETEETALNTLPRSMKTEWTELMFMQIKEGSTAVSIFALAVMCVFLALAALYESWALPLAVILVVPLCVLSCVVGVLAANGSINIFVQIGLVVLVGLACKNAILVVEFARELHRGGKPIYEATIEASKLRLRPIIMTSFAFILGVAPLVAASGAGAEMRRSLGVAVFSGMLGVTAFGIFLTPVFFYVIEGIGESSVLADRRYRGPASYVFAALFGIAGGFCLEQLGLAPPYWGMTIAAAAGLIIIRAARSIRRRY